MRERVADIASDEEGLMRLHRYGDAQPVLLQALSQLDPVQAKHRCTAHIDLADAYACGAAPAGAGQRLGLADVTTC